ncbi:MULTISPECIES: hypothetical protein [Microcoleaceae]|uniref:hypothetical protein n=1 Tax=Microcoleaceae TaxID=1892252 RepID=UPI00188200FB|nr:hypothetical protein [Tychonema sp. LEGE 06208]MBE9163437.1 hypothetical protein [Tychonema sp. LEGE 06208]
MSPNFPEIAIAQLIPATVERAWQVGNLQALEEFESAILSVGVAPVGAGFANG